LIINDFCDYNLVFLTSFLKQATKGLGSSVSGGGSKKTKTEATPQSKNVQATGRTGGAGARARGHRGGAGDRTRRAASGHGQTAGASEEPGALKGDRADHTIRFRHLGM